MAEKTIPDLTELTTIDENSMFPFDSGIQSHRVSGKNLSDGLAAMQKPKLPVWRADLAFNTGDLVIHNGVLYLAKANSTSKTPPSAEWELMPINGSQLVTGTVTGDKILNGTILDAKIGASANITRSKLGALNFSISSGAGIFSKTTYGSAAIPNNEIVFNVKKASSLVEISFFNALANLSIWSMPVGSRVHIGISVTKNGSAAFSQGIISSNVGVAEKVSASIGSVKFYDQPASSGNITYKAFITIVAETVEGSLTLGLSDCKMIIKEL